MGIEPMSRDYEPRERAAAPLRDIFLLRFVTGFPILHLL